MKRLLVLLALFLSACQPVTASTGHVVTVTHVADGDTFTAGLEKVRLIGVDTPETVDPHRPVGCYGKDASDHTKAWLAEGTQVRLELDKEPTDRYKRTLAYVFILSGPHAGTFLNDELVRDGYARPLYVAPNGAHRSQFEADAAAAKRDKRGLWGKC